MTNYGGGVFCVRNRESILEFLTIFPPLGQACASEIVSHTNKDWVTMIVRTAHSHWVHQCIFIMNLKAVLTQSVGIGAFGSVHKPFYLLTLMFTLDVNGVIKINVFFPSVNVDIRCEYTLNITSYICKVWTVQMEKKCFGKKLPEIIT